MSSKKARPSQSVRIRRINLRVVEIEFSGIPGDRDLYAMADALDALGYEVYETVIGPDDDDAPPGYRARGTEDHGPDLLPPD